MRRFYALFAFALFVFASCQQGTYTIRFRDDESNSVQYVTAPISKPIQLLSSAAFSSGSSGKRLMMWSTRKSDEGEERSEQEITNPVRPGDLNFLPSSLYEGKESLTLYAIWSEAKAKITFDANGGNFGSGGDTIRTDVKYLGRSYKIPSASDGILSGISNGVSTLLGWTLDKSAANQPSGISNDALYVEGDEYTGNGAAVFYAVWGSENMYIRFVLNENSVAKRVEKRNDGGQFRGSASLSSGDRKILRVIGIQGGADLNAEPHLEGCRFIGWSANPNLEPSDNPNYTSQKDISGEDNRLWHASERYVIDDSDKDGLTLYAIWSEISYDVTYQPDPYKSAYDGGALSDIWNRNIENPNSSYNNFDDYKNAKQKKYYFSDLKINVDVPVCEGYTFLGWRRSQSVLYQTDGVIRDNVAMTLYGQWSEKDVTYTVDFTDGYKPVRIITDEDGETELDLPKFFDSYSVSGEIKARAKTTAVSSKVYTYKYWTQRDHRDDIYITISDIDDISRPTALGYNFDYWSDGYGCEGSSEGSQRVTSATRFALSLFECSSDGHDHTEDECDFRECLEYTMKIYSRWVEQDIEYSIEFAEGERNDYIVANPEKSVITGAPRDRLSKIYGYWEDKVVLNKSDVFFQVPEGLDYYSPTCLGFTFLGWSTDESGQFSSDADTAVKGGTTIALERFVEKVEGDRNPKVIVYSRWSENEVEYTVNFQHGSTEKLNAYMIFDDDSTNTENLENMADSITYKVKYWTHITGREDGEGGISISNLDTLDIPTYAPFESYWSPSPDADKENAITKASKILYTSFEEESKDKIYSINLYSHWGDPIVGKTMEFSDYHWIILSVDSSAKSFTLLLNADAPAMYYDVSGVSTADTGEIVYGKQDWGSSSIRNYINGTLRNTFPDDVKNVNAQTSISTTGKYWSETQDWLWLPSSQDMDTIKGAYDGNSVFKANFTPSSSKWWQRDNTAASNNWKYNSALDKNVYHYTYCASPDITTFKDDSTSDIVLSASYRVIGKFSY